MKPIETEIREILDDCDNVTLDTNWFDILTANEKLSYLFRSRMQAFAKEVKAVYRGRLDSIYEDQCNYEVDSTLAKHLNGEEE